MSDDAALSPVEGQAWIGFLRVHMTIVRALDRALQSQQGVSLAEFEVLLYLSVVPDHRRRLSDLSTHSLISLSGMSRLIDRLERAGLVVRQESPEDRRGLYVALTEHGNERFRAADEAHQRDIRAQFTSHFSDEELRQMAHFWERLQPGVTEAVKPPAE